MSNGADDLGAAVRYRLGVPSSDSFYTDAVIVDLLNEALNWYSAQWDWPWLEKKETLTTSGSTETVALASDYSSTVAVTDAVGVPLIEKPMSELQFMGSGEAGVCRYYTIWDASIYLRPIPNGAFSVYHYYRQIEDQFTSLNTDVALIPVQYENVVVEYATGLALQRAGNLADASERIKRAEAQLASMRERSDRKTADQGGGERPAGQGIEE